MIYIKSEVSVFLITCSYVLCDNVVLHVFVNTPVSSTYTAPTTSSKRAHHVIVYVQTYTKQTQLGMIVLRCNKPLMCYRYNLTLMILQAPPSRAEKYSFLFFIGSFCKSN